MSTLVNPAYRAGPDIGMAGQIQCIDSYDIAVATSDIDLADLIKVFKARKGFVVTGAMLQSTDLDSSTGVVLALGDGSDDDRFITNATIGQAGGFTTTLAPAGALYEFTADTDIYIKVTTAPSGTAAAGTVRAVLFGYIRKA